MNYFDSFKERMVSYLTGSGAISASSPSMDVGVPQSIFSRWLRKVGNITFLDQPGVQATNNQAEWEIRPAVIIRKNSFGNRSEKGANCQAILMSTYRTLKRRGLNPIDTVVDAFREYVKIRGASYSTDFKWPKCYEYSLDITVRKPTEADEGRGR